MRLAGDLGGNRGERSLDVALQSAERVMHGDELAGRERFGRMLTADIRTCREGLGDAGE